MCWQASSKSCQVSSVGLHLDHDVTLEVVLKALELELQDWREVIKQHPFACILQQWQLASCSLALKLPSGALLQGFSNFQCNPMFSRKSWTKLHI